MKGFNLFSCLVMTCLGLELAWSHSVRIKDLDLTSKVVDSNSNSLNTYMDRSFKRVIKLKKSFETMALLHQEVLHYPTKDLPEDMLKRRQIYFASVKNALANKARQVIERARIQNLDPQDLQIKDILWVNQALVFQTNKTGLRFLSTQNEFKKLMTSKSVVKPKLKNQLVDQKESVNRYLSPDFSPRSYDFNWGSFNWGLNEISLEMAERAHRNLEEEPLDGSGIEIGVIDSGIDPDHRNLRGKVKRFFDLRKRRHDRPKDYAGHGTQVSGVLVGGSESTGYRTGVAPGSNLIVAGGFKDLKDVFLGIQFLLNPDNNFDTQDQPPIINNSWGYKEKKDEPITGEEAIFRALQTIVNAGVLPVFAAGNLGPRKKTVSVPAHFPESLTVAAVDRRGRVPSFSGRGPGSYAGKKLKKPELMAPGKEVLTTAPKGIYTRASGTSIAAPFVSGGAALLLQIEPSLTAAQIKAILVESAKNEKGSWDRSEGYGLLNMLKATFLAREYRDSLKDSKLASPPLLSWMSFFKSPRQINFLSHLNSLQKGQWLHEGSDKFSSYKTNGQWIRADRFWQNL